MEILNVLNRLEENEVFLSLDGEDLEVSAMQKEVPDEIVKLLKANKTLLVDYLLKLEKTEDYQQIPAADQKEHYPLSPAQLKFWLVYKIRGKSREFNMPMELPLPNGFDTSAFEAAFNVLVERHESLRTEFVEVAGEGKQRIIPHTPIKIPCFDSEEEAKKEVTDFEFDLTSYPLYKVGLINENDNYKLFLNIHHSIGDGWSLDVISRDLLEIYTANIEDRPANLPELTVQYKDYAQWQNETASFQKAESYWGNQFIEPAPYLQLPMDSIARSKNLDGACYYNVFISEKQKRKIEAISNRKGSSSFAFFMTVLKILLFKLTSEKDIIVGIPAANRSHDQVRDLVGCFINVLMLRDIANNNVSFQGFLEQVNNTLINALSNQDYPFEQLLNLLKIQQEENQFPISPVFLNLLDFENGDVGIIEDFNASHGTLDTSPKFDLECYVRSFKNGYALNWVYDQNLFNKETIEYWIDAYLSIVDQVVDNVEQSIKDIQVFEYKINDEVVLKPTNDFEYFEANEIEQGIAQRFEKQVARFPDKTAIFANDTALTYRKLNNAANHLANKIKEKANNKTNRIALLLGHDEECVIGMLGTLKSGYSYVPIDFSNPVNRIQFILEDSASNIIVCSKDTVDKVNELKQILPDLKSIVLDTDYDSLEILPNPENSIDLSREAYVLYTSGSTGNPKGVIQNQRNVLHYIRVYTNNVRIATKDNLSVFSTYTFDASVKDIYGAILNGATVSFYSIVNDGLENLSSWIDKQQVSIIHMVPTIYRHFIKTLKPNQILNSVRLIDMGGEASYNSDLELFKKHFPQKAFYVNDYGPTEATIVAQNFLNHTSNVLRTNLPLGRSVEETEVFLVDENNQRLGIYEEGEIVFKSEYLSLGYLNRPGQTEKVFLTNLFKEGNRFYKSGDIGKMLPTGEIEFLYRKDSQVKINGVRIELAEIENQLEQLENINEAIVVVKEINSIKYLTAYVRLNLELNVNEIKNTLKNTLPKSMIPAMYIPMDVFPLTRTGKIDRKALPEPTLDDLHKTVYRAPETDEEKALVAIWEAVLGNEKIGTEDNFFDLGGHSLLVGQVINRIQKELNKSINFQDFFFNPTIKDLCKQLEEKSYEPIPQAPQSPSYPLTAAQSRFWVLSQLKGGSSAYNMPTTIQLNGVIDIELFQESFRQLINRHEILRTSFLTDEKGGVRQVVLPIESINFQLNVENFTRKRNKINAINKYIAEQNSEPFDLTKAPLLRGSLIKTKKEEAIIFTTIHHIIGDGWSKQILMAELVSIYNALSNEERIVLPELNIQFKDYAVWVNDASQIEKQKNAEKYWLEQFSGELPVLELPTYKARPKYQTFNGTRIIHRFSKDFLNQLKAFSNNQGATLFMTLMAGVNLLLNKYSGQKDIIIGTPVVGRDHPDLENQIGLYLNTLAIRTQIEDGQSFKDLLEAEKNALLKAQEYQNYPFDQLVNKLNLSRDTSRSALFDVLVVLQSQTQLNSLGADKQLNGLGVSWYQTEHKTAQFDIRFDFIETDELILDLEFNTDIYEASQIEKMFVHFENILTDSIQDSDKDLRKIEYLTNNERTQVLEAFNNTSQKYTEDTTIIELFESQVRNNPEQLALVFDDVEFSYSDLNLQATNLAIYLLEHNTINVDDLIGVELERNEWLIIALLAVLKTRAAYLPIDPNLPQDRKTYMISDSQCKLVIDEAFIEMFKTQEVNTNYTKFVSSKPDSLCYVLYTSGSTGKPKGVMVEHRNAVSFLENLDRQFKFNDRQTVAGTTNVVFDISFLEIFGSLCTGRKLVLFSSDELRSTNLFIDRLSSAGVEVLQVTPSRFKLLWEDIKKADLPDLKLLLIGGEPFPKTLFNLKNTFSNLDILNVYGPTETTIWSTCLDINTNDVLSIGKPLANEQVYILSSELQPQMVGVIGELCIGGAGVARGYLNREELTNEKFIDNPFVERERMYKTGDYAKWLPDGNIEFLGRKDDQVKIRGNRIELGEIEQALLKYSDTITQAVLMTKEINGDLVLVAYYKANKTIEKASLRSYMSNVLPEYMVPAYFVQPDFIPLNASGKVDKKALPEIGERDVIKNKFVAASTEEEKILVSIWQEVLGVNEIGVKDNFFDLGGHSLMIGLVVNRIQKELGKVISFQDFFTNPVIEKLSSLFIANDYKPIPKASENTSYPVTKGQNRIWVLSQLQGGSLASNLPMALRFSGNINEELFEESFRLLIGRHEILRTSFFVDENKEIRQQIRPLDQVEFNLERVNLTRKRNKKAIVNQLINDKITETFDLSNAPLIKATLIKLTKSETVLFANMHHIIGDGWSIELLISELVKIYNALHQNQKTELPELNIQFKDYAVWLNSEEQIQKEKTAEQFWLNQFAGEIPVLELPRYRPRPSVFSYNGTNVFHTFSKGLLQKLKAFSKANNASLFMTLMAGVNALLYRYTNQNDIIIGTPVGGRDHPDLENQIGMYLNTLAIRTRIQDGQNFKNLLASEKEVLIKAFENQSYPLDQLLGKLDLVRDTSRSPLFDVVVVLQNQRQLNLTNNSLSGLEVKSYELENKSTQVDVRFAFTEGEELMINLDYNTDVYDRAFAEELIHHFETLMIEMIKQPEQEIQKINFLSKEITQQLLSDFNETLFDGPEGTTLVSLFEEQVAKTPESTALVFRDKQITYQELNVLADRLAFALREEHDINTGDLVGVQLTRSEWSIISILGIMKTGGVYLPIDPDMPSERKTFVFEDAQPKLLITETEFIFDIDYYDGAVYSIDVEFKSEKPVNAPDSSQSSTDLAYVIYTSGSTGKPKGVMIEHAGIVNTISSQIDAFEYRKYKNSIEFASFSFDASVWETFLALLAGVSLHVLDNETRKDAKAFEKYIIENKIEIATLPPALLKLLDVNSLKDLKVLITAGEAAVADKVSEYLKFGTFINAYGPTETSICATTYKVNQGSELKDINIPIGKGIGNTQVYVLNDSQKLCPVGVPGELHIAGNGLARGYLNRSDLTLEKFVSNPFDDGKLMYKTGDVCRWLPDGNIEFVGRTDDQVKIRGYRIELGEIESQLSNIEGVNNCVVLVQENDDGKFLVAYYVLDKAMTIKEIQTQLTDSLPDYMVPSYYIELDSIPLTTNGKLNKKALPGATASDLVKNTYVAPRNKFETELVGIWQEILNIDKIGINDNIFELGGHSLTLIKIVNQINKKLSKNLSVTDFFQDPTISGIVQKIEEKSFCFIEKAPEMESYPVTSSQRRLWVLSQFEEASLAYNANSAVVLKGTANLDLLKASFDTLVRRHESLRTSFKTDEQGNVRQFIIPADSIDLAIPFENLCNRDNLNKEIEKALRKINSRNFDLKQAPLFRCNIIKIGSDEHLFVFSMHHIIGDGWSMELLVNEVMATYKALVNGQTPDLPDLPIQYKDYAVWLEKEEQQEKIKASEKYWMEKFSGDIPVLELPTSKPRPKIKTYNGATIRHQFSKNILGQLNEFSKQSDATLFMTLMASVNILLAKYSSQDDIIIGTPVAGREHADLENQIGLYLNTLALRTQIDWDLSFSEILKEQKKTILEAFENQNFSFDELVDQLQLTRDTSRSALFDVMVVLQNQIEKEDSVQRESQKIDGLTLEAFDTKSMVSKFDLNFEFVEGETLYLGVNFNTDIFEKAFIEKMVKHLEVLILNLIELPEQKISEINYLTSKENDRTLHGFNHTNIEYPKEKTVVELFTEQVEQQPDCIALTFGDLKITYRELEARANQMSNYLRESFEVERDDLIGVKLERSEQVVITILGILKSGGAYVPIDMNYPQERIDFILEDSQCKTVIDQATFDLFDSQKATYSKERVDLSLPNNLAYMIYTSGSTGKPKGVRIEHSSLLNYLLWAKNYYGAKSVRNLKFGLFTSLSFDLTVTSFYLPLISGNTLEVFESTDDISKLLFDYFNSSISCIKLTPSHINILESLNLNSTNINLAIVGGEALLNSQIRILRKLNPNIRIVNEYGPTESTVGCIVYDVRDVDDMVLIGKPIANTKIYILDQFLNNCGVGINGEIYVAGAGLARDYLNRPDMTSDRFVECPFLDGALMYKTGDLGRWKPDGNIEYLGRVDDQVKIRGHRIELGEIENVALQFSESLKQLVVQPVLTNGDASLAAYYVSDTALDKSEFRKFLSAKLPDYMVPGFYVEMEAIPLTSNGKINRKKLPEISGGDIIRQEYIAPRNEIEEKLVSVVCSLLEIENDEIGIHDNFFDLGMSSLSLIKLRNIINAESDFEINIAILFEFSTIDELANKIYELQNGTVNLVNNNGEDSQEQFDEYLEQLIN